MSDWGATHSAAKAANAGLDQQSGRQYDPKPFFAAPLRVAVNRGQVSEARLDEMASRVLRTLFAKGVVDQPVKVGPIDFKAHAAVARRDAEQGAVLLKNQGGVLPLDAGLKRIAVIGGYADVGVPAGGGSSVVYPVGGNAMPGLKPTTWPGPVIYHPSAPLAAIRAAAPAADLAFSAGDNRAAAARLAGESDVAVVFVTQWTTESEDASLILPAYQDALIAAVASANPRTIVVLETGGPVLMPWIDKVAAVLEAWYPGTSGGEAIANLLFGKVDPSGRLPVTFLRDAAQLARPDLWEKGPDGQPQATYAEGAAVGYKWHDAKGLAPLFPFGHGLSYTSFAYDDLKARLDGQDLVVSFRVRNTGGRSGMDTPQVYVSPAAGGWEAPKRLGGWKKVDLKPGASERVELRVDPRLLAVFNGAAGGWRIAPGVSKVQLGASSADLRLAASIQLPERRLPVTYEGPASP
jgi:beta-glucosidase